MPAFGSGCFKVQLEEKSINTTADSFYAIIALHGSYWFVVVEIFSDIKLLIFS